MGENDTTRRHVGSSEKVSPHAKPPRRQGKRWGPPENGSISPFSPLGSQRFCGERFSGKPVLKGESRVPHCDHGESSIEEQDRVYGQTVADQGPGEDMDARVDEGKEQGEEDVGPGLRITASPQSPQGQEETAEDEGQSKGEGFFRQRSSNERSSGRQWIT